MRNQNHSLLYLSRIRLSQIPAILEQFFFPLATELPCIFGTSLKIAFWDKQVVGYKAVKQSLS